MTAMLFLISMSFGGIWEIMEGMTDFFSGQAYMIYGANDTLGDMSADLLGVVLMTIIAYIILGKQSAQDTARNVRLGKAAFKVEE